MFGHWSFEVERQEAEMVMVLFFLQIDCKIIEIYLHLPHFILTDSDLAKPL